MQTNMKYNYKYEGHTYHIVVHSVDYRVFFIPWSFPVFPNPILYMTQALVQAKFNWFKTVSYPMHIVLLGGTLSQLQKLFKGICTKDFSENTEAVSM